MHEREDNCCIMKSISNRSVRLNVKLNVSRLSICSSCFFFSQALTNKQNFLEKTNKQKKTKQNNNNNNKNKKTHACELFE